MLYRVSQKEIYKSLYSIWNSVKQCYTECPKKKSINLCILYGILLSNVIQSVPKKKSINLCILYGILLSNVVQSVPKKKSINLCILYGILLSNVIQSVPKKKSINLCILYGILLSNVIQSVPKKKSINLCILYGILLSNVIQSVTKKKSINLCILYGILLSNVIQSVPKKLSTVVSHFAAETVGFLGRKNPQHAFLLRGSKAVCPMSQICGMLKTPGNYVEVGFSDEICRPFLAHFRSSLPEGSHVA